MPPEKDNEDSGQFEASDGSQFEGGDNLEGEDLSALDRGDEIEPVETKKEPEPEPEKEVEKEPEPEPEKEVEPEPEPEKEVAEADKEEPVTEEPVKKPRSKHVPRERFDQVNDRMRAAEEALRKLEDGVEGSSKSEKAKLIMEAVSFDFDGQEEAYMSALLDGDVDAAKKIRSEIRVAEREEFTKSIPDQSNTTAEATAQMRTEMAIDVIIQDAAAAFPAVDPESEVYDQLVVDEVLETQNAFMVGSKMSADKAMARAVRLILGDTDESPAEVEVETPTKEVEKKVTDIKKNVAASEASPAKIDTAGQRADSAGESAFDITSLSDDEFDALPESKLRSLRGDI